MPIATPEAQIAWEGAPATGTGAQPTAPTGPATIALERWNAREWQAIRHAVYRTLLDMTVFPALSHDGVPLPNALRHTAVEHGLIDPATSQPTDRLLWLNPGLRPRGAPA